MNYELAKQLKEAGFPRHYFFYPENEIQLPGSPIRLPNLSELIEACYVDRFRLYDEGGWWSASGYHMRGFTEEGKTPEEAVARLWLALKGVV